MKISKRITLFLFSFSSLCVFFLACSQGEERKKVDLKACEPSSSQTLHSSAPRDDIRFVNTPKADEGEKKTDPFESSLTIPPPPSPSSQPSGLIPVTPSHVPDSIPKKDVIPVALFKPEEVTKGIPEGWELIKSKGTPELNVVKESNMYSIFMKCDGESSFGIRKRVEVNVQEYPFLNWRWKVTRLPSGGDVRKRDADDQAIQLYVAFASTDFPARLNTPVIGYVWDNEAPKGWMGKSTQIGAGKVRYIVLRNGSDELDKWYSERRNVYEDYMMLFREINGGIPQGKTQGIHLHINSQHTKSGAESFVSEIYFSAQ